MLLALALQFVFLGRIGPGPVLITDPSAVLIAEHDNVNTTGYRCYLDSRAVGEGDYLLGLVHCPIDMPAGPHIVQVSAYNEIEEALSEPLRVLVKRSTP